MKIVDVRATTVTVPLQAPLRHSNGAHWGRFVRTIVEVEADNGLVGLGEMGGGGQSAEEAVRGLRDYLVGHDPARTETLRFMLANPTASLYNNRTQLLAAIEFACLDLQGRHLGVPVHELLGGRVRDHVEFASYLFFRYPAADGGGEVRTPEQLVEHARELKDRHGFTVHKLKGGVFPPDYELECYRALAEAFPADRLRHDPNGAWSPEESIRFAAGIEGLRNDYLEDPTWGMNGLRRVRERTTIPIATNTVVVNFEQLAANVRDPAVDVVLLDTTFWGGIRPCVKAAGVCETFQLGVAVHSSGELGIQLATMLHLGAVVPNLSFAADAHYHHLTGDVIAGRPFRYDGGAIAVPDGPGLGVELDRDKVAEYAELYRELGGYPYDRDPGRPGWYPLLPNSDWADPAAAGPSISEDADPMRLIPTVEDFASDPIAQYYDDMVNPPGLTNFLGAVQADHDITAVRSVNFAPVSHGDTVTGALWVDGRLFRSFGVPVTLQWRPDRVVRSARLGDLDLETTTVTPPGVDGVVVDIAVTNTSSLERKLRLGLSVASTATQAGPWRAPEPPSEPNALAALPDRAALLGRATTTAAVSVQGLDADGARAGDRSLEVDVVLAPGERYRFGYVHVVGTDAEGALAAYDSVVADVPGQVAAARTQWDDTLRAAFTPGNDQFSGHVPTLETSNDALRRLYWWGVLGVIWFRRDSPASHLGRVYDTLMPRYWQTTTFIWDFSLSSMIHALLDPVPMRRQIEHWIALDIHRHFGTEWQTGGPAGYWYSVNDYAMIRLVRDYVRWNGEPAFLDVELAAHDGPAQSVAAHVADWATAWEGFRKEHALADYGGIDNLLECVSSYVHEVASLNAANVWCLRAAADVVALRGDDGLAGELRAKAAALVPHVGELYVEGQGFWHARQPDGRLLPVRHCYDFTTVGMTIAADLPVERREEMVEFFVRELQTPSWMRALSPYDDDAAFSVRPDHQWNGAYPAWPADAARSLIELGRPDVAAEWLTGLARTANQGPPGQAHFVEEAAEPINGGAVKSPPQFPYLIDWSCSSAGSWSALVIEGFFGVRPDVDGSVTVSSRLAAVDPDAKLRGLRAGGRLVDVDAGGVADSQATHSSGQG